MNPTHHLVSIPCVMTFNTPIDLRFSHYVLLKLDVIESKLNCNLSTYKLVTGCKWLGSWITEIVKLIFLKVGFRMKTEQGEKLNVNVPGT